MIAAILITCLGIALSAFFSGSETGFYRVTRVRLEIDAKEGQLVARGLHWLATKANLVVATVLIGNNIANYLVSLGLVLISARILAPDSQLESALPLLMTPVLFIYGELLPKFLFYQAPYRLLRLGAPVMLLCTILFMPVSIFVLLLETISGWLNPRETPGPTASRERQELQRVLVEGQEAGVVLPIQREIAQNLFTYGGRPIRFFATPLRALPLVTPETSIEEVLQLASARRQSMVGVSNDSKNLLGYYDISELLLAQETDSAGEQNASLLESAQENQAAGEQAADGQAIAVNSWKTIGTAKSTETTITVLIRMQSQQQALVQILDPNGKPMGVVAKERLTALLLEQA